MDKRLLNTNITVLEHVKTALNKTFKHDIKDVILFGSRAEEKANEYSDYDILVILNKDEYNWKYKHKIMEVIYDIELEADIYIDIHILSEHELNNSLRGTQHIFSNAIKHGIYA
jgi:predicted nucleotidyltransferase